MLIDKPILMRFIYALEKPLKRFYEHREALGVTGLDVALRCDISTLQSINELEQPTDNIIKLKEVFDRMNSNFKEYMQATSCKAEDCIQQFRILSAAIDRKATCPEYMLTL